MEEITSPGVVAALGLRILMPFTTSIPSITLPNTVCASSRCGVGTSVMNHCPPPVFGRPTFAMDSTPGPLWRRRGLNSSGIVYPGPPLPVPVGSPLCAMKSAMTRWNVTWS